MKNLFWILTLLLVISGICFGGVIIKNRPVASSLSSQIVISWQTEDESGVVRFEILRASVQGTSLSEFSHVASINANGRSSDYKYEDKVFNKSDQLFHYKVRIHLQDGQYLDSEMTQYPVLWNSSTTSAARRTWGSIKAMFR